MLARGRGVPMIVGVGDAPAPAGQRSEALVDGTKGLVLIGPDERDLDEFRSLQITAAGTAAYEAGFRLKPGVTADGTPIAVHLNVADLRELDGLDPASCDGIGLVRTELLFGGEWPGEEEQAVAYRSIAEWAAGRPVTIRTLDAGGDKPIPVSPGRPRRTPSSGCGACGSR